MAKSRSPQPPDMVAMVRAGRTAEDLALYIRPRLLRVAIVYLIAELASCMDRHRAADSTTSELMVRAADLAARDRHEQRTWLRVTVVGG